MTDTILQVENLKVHFKTAKGLVKAVDGVNFCVKKGEILALVGESGCGKSVTSQSILRLIGQKKSEKISGSIVFKNEDLLQKSEEEMRRLRGNRISMILQDPMTSLNPVYKVGRQIAEVSEIHEKKPRKSAWQKAIQMIERVGIPSANERASQYPHQYSGGMRQRAVIAMALSSEPDVLIADEPTTALDVTIQSQILDLIQDLRDQTGAAVVLITHDLGVVAQICDRVAVMYAGMIVEQGDVKAIFNAPKHPYTQGLLASLPKLGSKERLIPIPGQPPNLYDLPQGCRFAARCPYVMEKCNNESPLLQEVSNSHQVSCWLEEESMNDQ